MTETKTVLYLSYTGMTDPLGQSQVLAYLKDLTIKGNYHFTIISFEKKEAYQKVGASIKNFCEQAGINWYPLSYTAKPPVLSTFKDVNRMKKLAFKLAKENHFTLVHCRSYIPALVGLQLKKKKGIPFLFDMRGFWADERIDGAIWKLSNPVYRFIYNYFKKKEKQFLQKADHIVSLTENAKQEILTWNLNIKPSFITVIPCCADFDLFDPANIKADDKEKVKKEIGIPIEAKIFTYLGSLGTWYLIEEMMAFAKTYHDKHPDSYFLIMTGEPESLVKEAAKKTGFDTAFLRIKKLPRSQVPLYLSLSRFSIFFIKPAYSKKASSPVKQGELMAMGIPVVCNDKVGDTALIVKENKAGVVLKDFNHQAFTIAIEEMEQMNFNSPAIRERGKEYFLLSRGVELYAFVYKQLIK